MMSHYHAPTGRTLELTHRAFAVLRAARAGRVHMSLGCEPDVFVDGLACCDQPRARALVHAGLLRATRPGRIGERVPAVLTEAGYSILSAGGHPAHGLIA
jgi:hypothetical protein